jgi:hypothetical protein
MCIDQHEEVSIQDNGRENANLVTWAVMPEKKPLNL